MISWIWDLHWIKRRKQAKCQHSRLSDSWVQKQYDQPPQVLPHAFPAMMGWVIRLWASRVLHLRLQSILPVNNTVSNSGACGGWFTPFLLIFESVLLEMYHLLTVLENLILIFSIASFYNFIDLYSVCESSYDVMHMQLSQRRMAVILPLSLSNLIPWDCHLIPQNLELGW